MSWSEVLNHDDIRERFRKSVSRHRLASTYLFVGPAGIGKRIFALKLAQALLCETNPETELEPCDTCPACQQVRAATHPDLIQVARPKDKNFIPLETFIGDKEHRRQEGLVHDIGLRAFRGGRKIAIIDDADFLNQEGANCLLKTLEEPPPKSLLILIGTSIQKQLPTIVSRSQVVRFRPLRPEHVEQILRSNELVGEDVDIDQLVHAARGSIEMAIQLADPDVSAFRHELFSQLANLDPGESGFSQTISRFLEGAGKEAAAKRQRAVLAGEFAIVFYRQLTQRISANVTSGEKVLDQAVDRALKRLEFSDVNHGCQIAVECVDSCIEMQRQIQANANQANVVAVWLRDLGRNCRSEHSAIPS